MVRDLGSRVCVAVLVVGLAAGVYLRVRGLSELPLFGDEYHTLLAADASYGTILGTFDNVGSHVPLPLLQRISLDLFGPGVVSYRLVALVPGLLTLLLAFPLLRAFVGRDAAALATCLLAVNPMHVYYSRFARSYALALLLALVLGWAVLRLLEPSERPRRGLWTALVASAALLPWVHLSTLGFVLALALAGSALAAPTSRALALRFAGAFALAGALAGLLFLPVLGQVLKYFRVMESEPPPLGWFGVPTLIAGGELPAWAWLLGLGGAAGVMLRARRAALVLSLAALLGPLALLLATNPRGMDYAWARYILSALPFLAAMVALAFLSVARWLPGASGQPLLLLVGAGLCALQHLAGPQGPRSAEAAAFSNTYLALHPLEAFDEPFRDAPGFYRTLAEDAGARRIVETPPIYTRAVLLYRNYARLHGKDVVVGWPGEMPRGVQAGPYVRLLEIEPGHADYIVLHRDPRREVPEYFAFVYDEVWPRMQEQSDETFMRRQETIYGQNLVGTEATDPLASRLRERHGPAFYKDERILVWKLAP